MRRKMPKHPLAIWYDYDTQDYNIIVYNNGHLNEFYRTTVLKYITAVFRFSQQEPYQRYIDIRFVCVCVLSKIDLGADCGYHLLPYIL